MFQHLLVPLDGSLKAEAALSMAASHRRTRFAANSPHLRRILQGGVTAVGRRSENRMTKKSKTKKSKSKRNSNNINLNYLNKL